MADKEFFSVLTKVGKAALANAAALGTTVTLTEMAVGDGGGADVSPEDGMTALVNEVYRAAINVLDVVDDATMRAELVIPASAGGFYGREMGVFDDSGQLFAVANLPDTYKPALAEGAGRELTLVMLMEIADSASVTLKIDPTVILATRSYADAAAAEAVATHNADADAHPNKSDVGHTHVAANITDLLNTPRSYAAIQAYTPVVLEPDESGAVEWDLTAGAVAELTLDRDVTVTMVNGVPGSSPLLRTKQDATGGWAVIWPSGIRWAGGAAHEVATDAGAEDAVQVDVAAEGTIYAQGSAGYSEVS